MAIIVDPDALDRNQVIFGTFSGSRKLSLYPAGTIRNVAASGTNGSVVSGSVGFTASGASFVSWGVVPGDVICVFNSASAGHFVVGSVTSATVLSATVAFSATESNLIWEVRNSSGSIVDGVTEQCVYSFAKEEWKTDSKVYGGDNLIRHEFPFEPITSEQFEVGGGAAHANWDYFNEFTRKKVRTGGWAKKNTAGTNLSEYTGIITLGSLDIDSQVYYQQSSSIAVPQNFTFLGAVNEPISIFESGSVDYRSYLKLFVRKKGRTYAGSQISDIGVSTIQSIVNRFPLTHAVDAAIVASDAEVLGGQTFREQSILETGTDGATANVNGITGTFTSAGSTFTTNGVVAGDTLHITVGTWAGYWRIVSVDSETVLTVSTSEEGPFTSVGSQTFEVTSTYIVRNKTDGAIANVSGVTGTITSAGSTFVTDGVAAGDLVIINDGGVYDGVYKVISVDSETVLTLNTTDKQFGTVSSVNFDVVNPGMYLQSKEETITLGTFGTLTFADANPDTLTRSTGNWTTDGVTAGSVLTIAGTVSNNGSFTVASVDSATQVTVVATDTLVAESAGSATMTAKNYFKRTINGVIYAFKWRLTGIGALATNCYEFIQHQLRQSTDIDFGPNSNRGDVTDLLMSYQAPTGLGLNLIIDDIDADDTNNVSYRDATGISRSFPFVAAGSISFNTNLQEDAAAVYTMFFTNDDAGDNTGRDYGTARAIIVKDSLNADITGNISAQPSVSFTYDYDGNVQRGAASAGTNAPVTIVAIGLTKAQFVITTGQITRAKGISFSLVSALERNYSNP